MKEAEKRQVNFGEAGMQGHTEAGWWKAEETVGSNGKTEEE